MANPLADLRSDKLHMATVENVHPGSNVEYALFDEDGPGTVVSFWMALGQSGVG